MEVTFVKGVSILIQTTAGVWIATSIVDHPEAIIEPGQLRVEAAFEFIDGMPVNQDGWQVRRVM